MAGSRIGRMRLGRVAVATLCAVVLGTGVAVATTGVTPAVAGASSASISLVQTTNPKAFTAPNTLITYSFQVTNTGGSQLTGVGVANSLVGMSPVTCPTHTLAANASTTCTATYTTTQGDVDAGSVRNTATASGTPSSGPTVTATRVLGVPATQSVSVTVAKSADISDFSAAGTPVNYSYLVTDTGNVTLHSIAVTDGMPGLSALSCPTDTLAPGATETCGASYTTTQADVDAGGITNTANVVASPPGGGTTTASATLTIASVEGPSIALTKTADTAHFGKPGVNITYSYAVTNTGNVTLNNVGVTDPMAGLTPVICPQSQLAPEASTTCTATYATTQADVDAGGASNTATATGTPPTGSDVTATDSLVIPSDQAPSVTVSKTANVANFAAVGTPITYSYLVTNTGNVTLTSVGVTDPQAGLSTVACPAPTLAPAATETCTATYSTTQADLDAGGITNLGTVTATPPSGPAVTGTDSLTVDAVQSPSLSEVKTASIQDFGATGTPITYSYALTNTGNVTLSSVAVSDMQLGLSPVNCPSPTLAPGATETCTATYTTTQADLDAGGITNVANASSTAPQGQPVVDTATLTVVADQAPALSLTKTASVPNITAAGTPVTYSYLVANTGNVTLSSVGVTDPQTGLSLVACPTPTLAPGASETCTATYTTIQTDIDAGGITNIGTATAQSPAGAGVSTTGTLFLPAIQSPSIGIAKSASIGTFGAPNVPVLYSYKVTNTGNTTLTSVGVSDPMAGLSSVSCPTSVLAPAATETCTASYSTTQADLDAGGITNVGTATGTPPSGGPVTHSDTAFVAASLNPSIGFQKLGSVQSFSSAGTLITYSYLVTDSGNTSISKIVVTDPQPGLSAVNCPVTSLQPGGTATCTATYTTTQGDMDAGFALNSAKVTAKPSHGSALQEITSLTIPAVQSPGIAVAKSADVSSFGAPGALIHYGYLVTNTGNVTLTSVHVADPQSGLSPVSCPAAQLAPAATETCTATYTTSQVDVDAGSIVNVGTATGTPPFASPISNTSELTIPATQTPGITVAKSANVDGFSSSGVPVTYSYLVTNSGNVTLTSVGVNDPMTGLSSVSCPSSTLAPGATETCTATYSTTQGDVDNGGITNVGTASGTPPLGGLVSGSGHLTIPATQTPSIGILKTPSITSFSGPGTPVTYTYLVNNTGNVTLTSVGVTDPMANLSPVTCPVTTLAPGDTVTCVAHYTTTQADVDAGTIVNTGTAAGTPPSGPAVTATSSASVPSTTSPSIAVSKSASVVGYSAPGTSITYDYVVTNTGNKTLHSVKVSDPQPGLSIVTCPSTTLAPKAIETCTATYTTTQADVDAGSITNIGTASGTPPTGSAVTGFDTLTIHGSQSPAVAMVKSADVTTFSAAGTHVTYSYAVTDTGNVTLTSVHVTDPQPGLSAISCPSPTLAPGASETCTATYATTQADMDAGGASNTGTVVGTPPSGSNVAAPASLTIHAVAAPAITVVKKASVTSFSGVGTPITYTYVVTNTGNVTLSAVHVTDPQPGLSLVACPPGSLAPGAHVTCVATYATLLSDVLAGKAVNTGTASGTPPTGSAVTASSTVTVPFTPPSCYVGPWPSKVSGYPVLPDHAAPPAGVFIGQYHNEWLLYTHLVKGGTVYTGTITSTGSLLNTQLLRAEHDDKFAQPNIHTITFKFITASDLDGIAFNSTCGSTVTITLTTNNKPTAPSTVYLGNPTTSPTSLPLVFTRPY